MKSALELYESRIDAVDVSGSEAHVHFSHAYIHKSTGAPGRGSGTAWSQEALLIISGVISTQLPPLPNTISDGYLQIGAIKHALLPLPFKRKADASLSLSFSDGTSLNIVGRGAVLELLGKAIYLEDM